MGGTDQLGGSPWVMGIGTEFKGQSSQERGLSGRRLLVCNKKVKKSGNNTLSRMTKLMTTRSLSATPSVLPQILLTQNQLLHQIKKRTHSLGVSRSGTGQAWDLES